MWSAGERTNEPHKRQLAAATCAGATHHRGSGLRPAGVLQLLLLLLDGVVHLIYGLLRLLPLPDGMLGWL